MWPFHLLSVRFVFLRLYNVIKRGKRLVFYFPWHLYPLAVPTLLSVITPLFTREQICVKTCQLLIHSNVLVPCNLALPTLALQTKWTCQICYSFQDTARSCILKYWNETALRICCVCVCVFFFAPSQHQAIEVVPSFPSQTEIGGCAGC